MPMSDLETYLTHMDLVRNHFGSYIVPIGHNSKPLPDGFKYGSYEALVAAEGKSWRATKELPAEIKRGEPKNCFANAYRLALIHPELTYAEGWALSIIPIHHAWLVDEEGHVIDPTWEFEEGRDYIGIEFDIEYVSRVLLKSGTYGLFFKRESRDLLKEEDATNE